MMQQYRTISSQSIVEESYLRNTNSAVNTKTVQHYIFKKLHTSLSQLDLNLRLILSFILSPVTNIVSVKIYNRCLLNIAASIN